MHSTYINGVGVKAVQWNINIAHIDIVIKNGDVCGVLKVFFFLNFLN